MEKKIRKIYKDANDEISKKWLAFMDSHAPKLQKTYDALQEAIKSGDKAAIEEAKDAYQRAAMNITVNNKRFQGIVDETAAKISHTNDVALAYVNDQVPGIYTINYNAFGDEDIKGYSFSLVNEQAVKNLATTDKMLLPTKKLDIPKDMRWNAKNINSQMVQGILQGESIPKLAKRLGTVTDMNRVSAIRNARTITTAAENKGRQDSFKKATADGVIMKRIWVATTDDRTRAWHADLDGVEVDVDEPWENDYGEISYPGDPTADPANVYNCRCSIRAHVKGFKWGQTGGAEVINQTASHYDTGIIEGNMKSVNSDITNLVSENIANWNEQFTGIKEYLQQGRCYFDEEESKKYGVMSAVTTINADGPMISRFVFGMNNKEIYESIDNLERYVSESVKSKWYMPCDESHLKDYLEAHEYGHVVQNYILGRDYKWGIFKTSEELADVYNDRCTQIYKELVKTGMESGIIKDLGESIDNLSRYSLKRAGEGVTSDVFAESFANMICGSPNEWGKTMEVYLSKKGILR